MSEAVSVGVGLALGLIMTQSILQTTKPPIKGIVKVLICQRCAAQNPIQNKFCGNCGHSLYPALQVTCTNCGLKTPANMKFCGHCGSKRARAPSTQA